MGAWQTETWDGPAGGFHDLDPEPRRTLWDVRADGPALVLGSTQDLTGIDTAAAHEMGVATPRRRSGGGAVWVDRGSTLWVDIVIPREDPLWEDDVPRSMLWLGRLFAGIIGNGATVFDGSYARTDLSRAYCFGGLAPGEVTGPAGKLVGISQRRTRSFARFQCVAYSAYDPSAVARFFSDPAVASGVIDTPVQLLGVSPQDVVAALTERLPS